jgi:hypothetical protein
MMAAEGVLLALLGLVAVAYGIYALVRGGRDQEGGLGPAPERAIHAVAGVRMLIGGTVGLLLGIVAILASLSDRIRPGRSAASNRLQPEMPERSNGCAERLS